MTGLQWSGHHFRASAVTGSLFVMASAPAWARVVIGSFGATDKRTDAWAFGIKPWRHGVRHENLPFVHVAYRKAHRPHTPLA